MIRKEELYKIGKFNKPHGVQGELLFTFVDDIFDRVDCDYLVCEIDGIFVPFYIKEYRFKSDSSALVLLDGVETVEKARMFTNVDVYFPTELVGEAQQPELSVAYLIGFTAQDIHHGILGKITDIDDSTANVLFSVLQENGKQVLIPVHDELITEIDHKNKLITFDLPEGLVTMNHEGRD